MCSGRVKVHDRLKQVPEMWFGRDGVLAPPQWQRNRRRT
jgi:hypothetical protein